MKRKSLGDFFKTSGITQWTCAHCTFINHKRREACEMCRSERSEPENPLMPQPAKTSPSSTPEMKRSISSNSPLAIAHDLANHSQKQEEVQEVRCRTSDHKKQNFLEYGGVEANTQKREKEEKVLSAPFLGKTPWTTLLHRMGQSMTTNLPQTATEWLHAIRAVCGHPPSPVPNPSHHWGALVPTYRPPATNLSKRCEPYCSGYVPLFSEDTRPPGCGDACFIDGVRRSMWFSGPQTEQEEADKIAVPAENLLVVLRAVAASRILAPSDCVLLDELLTKAPHGAQLLYASLFLRRGPWFRLVGYGLRTQVTAESPKFASWLHAAGWAHTMGTEDLMFSSACVAPRGLEEEEEGAQEEEDATIRTASVCDIAFLLTLLTVKELGDLAPGPNRVVVSVGGKTLGPKATVLWQVLQRIVGVRSTTTPKAGSISKQHLLSQVWSKLGVCMRLRRQNLVQRAVRGFFITSGYLPEEAANVLLHLDLSTQTFASPLNAGLLQMFCEQNVFLELDKLVLLSGRMEAAIRLGDESTAYLMLHEIVSTLPSAKHEAVRGARASEAAAREGPPRWAWGRMTVGWLAARLTLRGVMLLEREKRYLDAIHYCRLLLLSPVAEIGGWHRGQAFLRLVMDLDKVGEKAEALQVCERALLDTNVQGSVKIGLRKACLRLSQRPPVLGLLLQAPERYMTGRREAASRNWVAEDGTVSHGVEAYVLACYQREGWEGCHAENSLWLTLINLLAFDILRPPELQGGGLAWGWSSAFQDHPLGLWGAHMTKEGGKGEGRQEGSEVSTFYLSRKRLIEQRLQELRGGHAAHILAQAWTHCHRQALFVNWTRHPLPRLQAIVEGVGSAVLVQLVAAAFKTHLFEAVCCGGFPDLSLWRPGAVKLVEVKGPGDSLSDKQRGVLHLLLEGGADVEVCYVRQLKD